MTDPGQTAEEQIARLKLQEAELSRRIVEIQLRKEKVILWTAVMGLIAIATTTAWATATKAVTALGKGRPIPLIDNPPLAFFLHGIQATIIFFFVRKHRQWLRRIATALQEKAPDAPIAKKTLSQFTLGWEYMWYGWLVLYTWFTIAALIAPLGASAWVESVSDILDIVSGFGIWWCYLSLDVRSVNVPADLTRDRPFWRAVAILAAAAIGCIALSVTDRVFHIGYFGIVLVGIFNALGIASFTGRLGSHYIDTPRWALSLLYFYAMLQIFYSLLPLLNTKLWIPAVYICALLLKVVLAFVGLNMMRNGGLIRYLEAAESGLLDVRALDNAKWAAVTKAAAGASPLSG